MRPEWTVVEEAVREGCEWLMHSRQPKNAGIHHSGKAGTHVGGHLGVSFTPWGHFTNRRGPRKTGSFSPDRTLNMKEKGYGTVCFQMPDNEWVDYDSDPWRYGPPIPAFTDAERKWLTELVRSTGADVDQDWSSGDRSHSVGVRNVTPTLKRAASNYMDGCPEHDTVFCSKDGCDWYKRIHNTTTWPVLPSAPAPAGPPADPGGDDDSNLRAIKEAIEKITPFLVEMGVHAGTVVAGRRGHIVEHPDGLEFEADTGHGVLLPAEVVTGLVAAAALVHELGLDEEG